MKVIHLSRINSIIHVCTRAQIRYEILFIHQPGLTSGYKRFPLPFSFMSLIFLQFFYFLITCCLKVCCGIRDLSFVFIWKLHQIHFVFLLILLGYQSLFYTSSLSSSQDLISIGGKEFTSHRIQILSFFNSSLVLSLVFIFGSEIY